MLLDEVTKMIDFNNAEKQLIEKMRRLRADKKKAVYVLFGVKEEK